MIIRMHLVTYATCVLYIYSDFHTLCHDLRTELNQVQILVNIVELDLKLFPVHASVCNI